MQKDRAVAVSKLAELIEHNGMRQYIIGYLTALAETDQLENCVHAAYGFMQFLNDTAPHVRVVPEVDLHDPRD